MSTTDQQLKKVLKTLKKLPAKLQNNVVSGGIRAAAAVVRDEEKERVAKDSRELEKAIYIKKRRTKKGSNQVRYTVLIRKKVLTNGKAAKDTKQYAYYLEYGTDKMRARPFIRVTLEAVGQKPVQKAREYVKKRLPKELKKIRG